MSCIKISYTKAQAENELKRAKHGSKRRKEIRKYFCSFHNMWHLTSQEEFITEVEELAPKYKRKWRKIIKKSRKISTFT